MLHSTAASPGAHLSATRRCVLCAIRPPLPPINRSISRPRVLQSQRSIIPCASASSNLNPIEAVKRENALQSNKLADEVRERVEGAVEKLRYRVTVGEVAASAGLKVSEADAALQALAYDSLAALEVGPEGDVVYTFPADFRSSIQTKSFILKVKPVLSKIQQIGVYMARVAFGTSLIASVAIVWMAILVVLSSSSRDDRNDRSSGRSYGGYSGGYDGGGIRMAMNLTDLFYWYDPYYYQNARQRQEKGVQMSFLESIFSFVFGDGDPNMRFEEARFKQIGQLIQAKGGVVSAEELAPFLDPPPVEDEQASSSSSIYADESFVLPALITFGGEPFVDNAGNLLYRFPSLQNASSRKRILEREWKFTAASGGQIFGTLALGLVNIAGVVILSNMLVTPKALFVLAANGLGWITNVLPWLQVYAAAFFGIPAFRWLVNMQRNAAIDARNMARCQAADALAAGSQGRLARKLAAARQEGQRRIITRQDSVFTTEKDTTEQVADMEAADWDAKLNSRTESENSRTRTEKWW